MSDATKTKTRGTTTAPGVTWGTTGEEVERAVRVMLDPDFRWSDAAPRAARLDVCPGCGTPVVRLDASVEGLFLLFDARVRSSRGDAKAAPMPVLGMHVCTYRGDARGVSKRWAYQRIRGMLAAGTRTRGPGAGGGGPCA